MAEHSSNYCQTPKHNPGKFLLSQSFSSCSLPLPQVAITTLGQLGLEKRKWKTNRLPTSSKHKFPLFIHWGRNKVNLLEHLLWDPGLTDHIKVNQHIELPNFQCIDLWPGNWTRKKAVSSLLVWWFIGSFLPLFSCYSFFRVFSNSCSMHFFFSRIYNHTQWERQGRVCSKLLTRNLKPKAFPFNVIIHMFRFRLMKKMTKSHLKYNGKIGLSPSACYISDLYNKELFQKSISSEIKPTFMSGRFFSPR